MTVWNNLPDSVRATIESHIGTVEHAQDVTDGRNSALAAVLHRADSAPVFVKGVRGISRQMRWLRNEITAGDMAPGFSPAVLFHADIEADDDWLVVGFEYIPGRAANLIPESPDLKVVGATLDELSTFAAIHAQPLSARWTITDWWARLSEDYPSAANGWDVDRLTLWNRRVAELVEGYRLLHTDLHADQFRISSDESVRVIDWAWPAAGAQWVDAAYMVIRLIGEGHSPEQAEKWARSLECFGTASDSGLDAFAAHVSGLWSYRAEQGLMPSGIADMARTYAAYRLVA